MNTVAVALTVAMLVAASDSPFVGTWKLNLEKSRLTGSTMTFEQLPGGETRMTAEGQSYTFRTDGQEYPAMFGSMASWRQVDANTWQAAYRMQGRELGTDTLVLSPDGGTLTVTTKGTKPDGSAFEQAAMFTRTGGSTGLAGSWKSTKVTLSPEVIEFAPSGAGLVLNVASQQVAIPLEFDGKDRPVTGPTVPPKATVSVTKTGERSFEMTQKIDGKSIYHGTYTLSPDGRTLTGEFRPEGTNEKFTVVYERQ